ncbi:RWD-domain-containing protein [Cystobasidium minutum MCA 4210]|uniref:RWD-domain-containing protein n=1 Tax=Cystobasidium minutum MCA 4210 TaxID=1397322 RepID=UPI0034CD3B84|eukprot:jgi/Rhomi1/82775/CE82774_1021
MASEAILEEREVLESILADDLEVTSDDSLQVKVEPEEGTTSITVLLLLKIKYTPGYPDEMPEISIEIVQGAMPEREEGAEEDGDSDDEDDEEGEGYMRLTKEDTETLLQRLREAGEENLGMAMVYTLVMQLKESLTELLVAKQAAQDMEEQLEQMKVQEAELAAPKGTPVTRERFEAWKKKFEAELRELRKRQLEEEIKALPPKERKERETYEHRLTGRQIFETKRLGPSAGDEDLEEDEAAEVDYSQYDREHREDDEDDKEEGILLADSDSD